MTHDEMMEQIKLLALDALPDVESREARAHAETCSHCSALLLEYQQLTAQLLTGVPSVTPPNIEARLRARAQSHPTRVRVASQSATRGFWQPLLRLPRAFKLSALAVLLMVLVGGLVVFWPQPVDEQAEFAKLRNQPDVVKVNIKGTERAPDATGQVVIDPKSNKAYVVVWKLDKLSKDLVYQIWLLRDGGRDNGGLLVVNDPREAVVRLQLSQPISAYREIGLTIEPATGSAGPTTPRVIGGALR
jgi:anti-sigma factor RsiW